MANQSKPTTILDVSKGLGYGLLYHAVIGKNNSSSQYPFAVQFRMALRPRRKFK